MKKLFTLIFATCFSVAMFGQEAIPAGGTWATARGIINTNFSLVAPKASPTFTGILTIPTTWRIGAVTITANGQELNILNGALVTVAELNHLVGVTSAIQTQLNGKSATSHNHSGTYEPVLGNPNTTGYVLSSTTAGVRSWIEMTGGTGGGYTNLTSFVDQTPWRLFYSNTNGDVTELALGANGTYLRSNGATSAPTFAAPSGAGDALTTDGLDQFASTTSSQLAGVLSDETGTGTVVYSSAIANFTTEPQVSAIVEDSINARLSGASVGISIADSTGNAPGNYVTRKALEDSIAANLGSVVDSALYVTVTRLTDSLNTMRALINDLIAAVEASGTDVTAPVFLSAEIGTFADDTLLVLLNDNLHVDSVPPITAFGITEDGDEYGIASVIIGTVGSDSLFIVADSVANFGSTYLLNYTRDFHRLQDSSYNPVANWTNKAVTNNMPESGCASATYTQNFTGFGEDNALGGQGNWIDVVSGLYTYNWSGNVIVNAKGTGHHASLYNAEFCNDQYSQIVDVLPGYSLGVGVRLSGSGATASGYMYYMANGDGILARIDAGEEVILSSSSHAIAENDVIRLEIVGTTLSCYINGSLDTTVGTGGNYTDATYSTGRAGIAIRGNASTFGDNWEGGNK